MSKNTRPPFGVKSKPMGLLAAGFLWAGFSQDLGAGLAHLWMVWKMKRAGSKNGNNADWQLWQQHNHPVVLDMNEMMEQRLDYLHLNPVESRFVFEPWHWKYCSAIDSSGGKGFLDIYFIE